jgi:hypothetical protein
MPLALAQDIKSTIHQRVRGERGEGRGERRVVCCGVGRRTPDCQWLVGTSSDRRDNVIAGLWRWNWIYFRDMHKCWRLGLALHWNLYPDRVSGPALEKAPDIYPTQVLARKSVPKETKRVPDSYPPGLAERDINNMVRMYFCAWFITLCMYLLFFCNQFWHRKYQL